MNCTRCATPTADGIHLCDTCTEQLSETLNLIPEMLTDLSDTTAKLDNHGGNGGSPGFQPTAPVRLGALETGRHLEILISSWASMLRDYDTRQHHAHAAGPQQYLTEAVPEIRRHDWAGEIHRELTTAVRKAQHHIDAPRDIRILGKCLQLLEDLTPCEQPLKVDGSAPTTVCPGCGTLYYTSLLERWNRKRIRGKPMSAAKVRRYLKQKTGITVKTKDFENWVYHGHLNYVLELVKTRGRERRLYFPGDVLEVQQRMDARRGQARY